MKSNAAHDDADHGHAAAPPTAEQLAEAEASARVQATVARRLGRPLGLLLAIGGAGAGLALLAELGADAAPHGWLWLLPAILCAAWGLALLRGERAPAAQQHH